MIEREQTAPLAVVASVPQTSTPRRSHVARLAPAHRDGLALVLSSGLTAVVGLLYWVLAARLFAPAALGLNSVALSTMMLLGGIGQLNMTYALLRFVPVAGRASRRLVLGGYVVGAGAATVVGALFALGAPLWAPELVEAFGRGPLLVFFVVATPLWAIFAMQDFVLTGIRRAGVVPVENLAFALLKIGLLVVAAVLAVPGGIAVSWVVSTALVVLAMNSWLLLRAVPRHARETADRGVPITVGAVARYLRADYAGAVFWQIALFGLPVVVLVRLGAEDAAVYGIVWTISQALYTVSSGMSQSMVAHSSADLGGIEQARRAMVRRALTLVVPVAVVVAAGAPLVLSVFGEHYARTGSTALVLAALSAIPNVVTASTVGAARVRQRRGVLFGVPATVTTIVLVISWLLMARLGIVAVGLAWLIAQLLMAGGILVATAPWLPPLIGSRIDAVRTARLLRRVRPLAATHAGEGWVVGERLTGRSDSVVVGYGPPDGPGALLKACDSPTGREQLRRQSDVLRSLQLDDRLGAWRALVPSVLGDGDIGGSYCLLESRLPGERGRHVLADPVRRRTFNSSVIATISELHRCTSTALVLGDAELRRWVHGPMGRVIGALPRAQRDAARRLEAVLVDRLRGRTVASGWTHGDFTADNVLADPDGRAVGIVDWCHADPAGMQVLDVVCHLLTSENMTRGTELGALVVERLADARPAEHELLARVQRMLGGDVLDVGLLTVLGWLQHVGNNIEKSPAFAANPIWTRRNLVVVVRAAEALLASSVRR